MDLITIRLSDLGENCLVTNDKGRVFLDLSKCERTIIKGYKDQWELKFTTRLTKNVTANGKKVLAAQMLQTDAEKESKHQPPYLGSGVRLYEDNEPFTRPNTHSTAKPASAPLPSTDKNDLPF